MTGQPNDQRPPIAPRERSIRELHGEAVADDYAWMRDTDHPRLRDYLVAERAYYDSQTQHLAQLAAKLAAEAAGRFPAADEYSVAWPLRGYTYRTRLPHNSDNVQLLRSNDTRSSESVLLDENLLAAQTGYIETGRPRAEPRRRAARLVCRHQRRRVLRPADPRSGDGRGPAGGHEPRVSRTRLGRRVATPVLPGARRPLPAVSDLATRRRHARSRRRARVRGARTSGSTSRCTDREAANSRSSAPSPGTRRRPG